MYIIYHSTKSLLKRLNKRFNLYYGKNISQKFNKQLSIIESTVKPIYIDQ